MNYSTNTNTNTNSKGFTMNTNNNETMVASTVMYKEQLQMVLEERTSATGKPMYLLSDAMGKKVQVLVSNTKPTEVAQEMDFDGVETILIEPTVTIESDKYFESLGGMEVDLDGYFDSTNSMAMAIEVEEVIEAPTEDVVEDTIEAATARMQDFIESLDSKDAETPTESVVEPTPEPEPEMDMGAGMDFDGMESTVQDEAPIMARSVKNTHRKASKRPSLTQVAQLVVTSIAREILANYKVRPEKAGMAALAVVRTLFSINKPASKELYLQSAADSAKYTNSKNNNKKAFHLQPKGDGIILMAEKVGYITIEDDVVTPTGKWNNLMVEQVPVGPSNAKISKKRGERLRKNIMKSHVKACKRIMDAVHILEETEYKVHIKTLENLEMVYENCRAVAHERVMEGKCAAFSSSMQYKVMFRKELNKMFPEEQLMVLQGCNAVKHEPSLWSEYDADARGRLYHVMCFGPNPQASDTARGVYSLNTSAVVIKGSEAYNLFIEELHDIGGGKFNNHETIMAVAKQPVRAMTKWRVVGGDAPKKPVTYARMCETYASFEEHGVASCTIGYGLDAKCSGTQYIAIYAGDANMARATGLTTHAEKVLDPYLQSLEILFKNNPTLKDLGLDRGFIKTPYMAVQYGGGVNALMSSKDFHAALSEKGITCFIQREEIAEACVDSIREALGDTINRFFEEVEAAVLRKCEALGKDFFQYKHSDGLLVKKPGYEKEELSPSFTLRIEELEQTVFGQLDEHGKPTGTWEMPSKTPDMEKFARTFTVNLIQGIDALVARTFIIKAAEAGLRGITSIHDCFRCCLADAPKMRKVIADTYYEVFVRNNQLEHLRSELAYNITQERADEVTAAREAAAIAEGVTFEKGELDCAREGIFNFYSDNIVTEEILYSENSYYFCI